MFSGKPERRRPTFLRPSVINATCAQVSQWSTMISTNYSMDADDRLITLGCDTAGDASSCSTLVLLSTPTLHLRSTFDSVDACGAASIYRSG